MTLQSEQHCKWDSTYPPETSNLFLSSDIPHAQLDILQFNCFYVKSDCGDGMLHFPELKTVQ
jgi:hypothetical protein